MPSLFDIGKSGLQAYRQSLAVTGQNIANVNTDGYKKRDVALEEVSGAGGGVTEISDQTGLGVRVEQIRRAFDEFLIDKARQASSNFKSADSFSDEVRDLENLLLPTDNNLSSSIGDFFNSLQDIAAREDKPLTSNTTMLLAFFSRARSRICFNCGWSDVKSESDLVI